jgi:chromosome partitioning protein
LTNQSEVQNFVYEGVQNFRGAIVKKIALIAQKGGVGKTTLAVNLAVAAETAGLLTVLFDLDHQESAVTWSERRGAETPHVEFLTERRLPDGLIAAEKQGFALAIIDTPPAAGPQALTAAQAADLVLVPCRPSLVDLDAIRRTAQLVKSAGVPAFVVFNAAPPGATTLIEDARAIVKAVDLNAAPIVVRERSAFRGGWPQGKAAVEIEPRGKAASEIVELMAWICEHLQMCTPASVTKIKRVANG